MTEPIDLTADESCEAPQYVPKARDEGSRKRVVALAEGLTERLRVGDAPPRKRVRKTAVDGVELPQQTTKADVQGRQTVAAAPAKPSAPASPAPRPGAPEAPEAPQPVNNLLAQLHAERLARMSSQSKVAMLSPLKAEPSKADGPERAGASRSAEAALPSSRNSASGPSASAATNSNRAAPSASSSGSTRTATVLTYNLWFNEEVALVERMGAVGEIIEREGYPDFLLFQEATPNIVLIFRQTNWFRRYRCSPVPEDKAYFTLLLARRDTVTLPAMQPWLEKEFDNSCMGRSILYTKASIGGRPLVVGTSHLESPVGPGAQQMMPQRQQQFGMAVKELGAAAGPSGDVLFAGDMNWNDSRDGPMPLPPRWCDVWQSLMPANPGLTWNPVCNPMLTSRWKGSRLDRVLCRVSSARPAAGGTTASTSGVRNSGGGGGGWRLGSIKMVGTQALHGLTYENQGKRLPVLPSDHFGLLVKLLPSEVPASAAAATGNILGGGALPTGPAASSAAAALPAVSASAPVAPLVSRPENALLSQQQAGRCAAAAGGQGAEEAAGRGGARTLTARSGASAGGGAPSAAAEAPAATTASAHSQRSLPPPSRPAAETGAAALAARGSVTQVDLSADDAEDDVIVL